MNLLVYLFIFTIFLHAICIIIFFSFSFLFFSSLSLFVAAQTHFDYSSKHKYLSACLFVPCSHVPGRMAHQRNLPTTLFSSLFFFHRLYGTENMFSLIVFGHIRYCNHVCACECVCFFILMIFLVGQTATYTDALLMLNDTYISFSTSYINIFGENWTIVFHFFEVHREGVIFLYCQSLPYVFGCFIFLILLTEQY